MESDRQANHSRTQQVVRALLVAICIVSAGCNEESSTVDAGGITDVIDGDVAPDTTGAFASRMIGSEGGELNAGAVEVSVPAGAVLEDVEFTVEETSLSPPASYIPYSPVFLFGPEGQSFDVPVEIRIEATVANDDAEFYWARLDNGVFRDIVSIDFERADDVFRASVDHFSIGWIGAPCRAEPETCDLEDNDCDGEVDEDFDLLTSLDHCGTCGEPCDAPNAVAVCMDGVCSVGGCDAGFRDCNGIVADGCEADLTSTLTCGACDVSCSYSNGVATCADGACELLRCNDGFDNCDGSDETGCEAQLIDDEANCGGCGFVCDPPNSSNPSCRERACLIGECDEGWLDANLDAADGCETECSPPGTEFCNGVDDDCDGEVDEDCDDECRYSGRELCDEIDNDCDGEVDEDCWVVGGECGSYTCESDEVCAEFENEHLTKQCRALCEVGSDADCEVGVVGAQLCGPRGRSCPDDEVCQFAPEFDGDGFCALPCTGSDDCDGVYTVCDTETGMCRTDEELCLAGRDTDLDGVRRCDDADCEDSGACIPGRGDCDDPRIVLVPDTYIRPARSGSTRTACSVFSVGDDEAFTDVYQFTPSFSGPACIQTSSSDFDTWLSYLGPSVGCDAIQFGSQEFLCHGGVEGAAIQIDVVAETDFTFIVHRPFERLECDPCSFELIVTEGVCPDDVSARGEICDDGIDNDGRMGADCDDPVCAFVPPCSEICPPDTECCGNRIDDDGDGDRDCDDSECTFDPFCLDPEICDDGFDNDLDEAVDCDDPDCSRDGACASAGEGFVLIPAGEFLMDGEARDEPARRVTLTRPFFMMEYEVTQSDWEELMGTTPGLFDDCPTCPVDGVNWWEVAAYANALSTAEGFETCYDLVECSGTPGSSSGMDCDRVAMTSTDANPYLCDGYRLPTEAEWEYAARAGTETDTYAGDRSATACPDPVLESIAWSFCNAPAEMPQPVGGLAPNAFGLYDMLGNVSEWTNDLHLDDYGTPFSVTDPYVFGFRGNRAVRGGGVWSPLEDLQCGARAELGIANDDEALGFRLVRTSL